MAFCKWGRSASSEQGSRIAQTSLTGSLDTFVVKILAFLVVEVAFFVVVLLNIVEAACHF